MLVTSLNPFSCSSLPPPPPPPQNVLKASSSSSSPPPPLLLLTTLNRHHVFEVLFRQSKAPPAAIRCDRLSLSVISNHKYAELSGTMIAPATFSVLSVPKLCKLGDTFSSRLAYEEHGLSRVRSSLVLLIVLCQHLHAAIFTLELLRNPIGKPRTEHQAIRSYRSTMQLIMSRCECNGQFQSSFTCAEFVCKVESHMAIFPSRMEET